MALGECVKNGCKQKKSPPSDFCQLHRQQAEAEKASQEDERRAKAAADAKAVRDAAAERQRKIQQKADEKTAAITKTAAAWKGQIDPVVKAVLQHRQQNPQAQGVNAGVNPGLTTLGGTNNPIALALPSPNPHQITRQDVLRQMVGLKSSDTAGIKFVIRDVFVHINWK